MANIHYHYDQLTEHEREFVDLIIRKVFDIRSACIEWVKREALKHDIYLIYKPEDIATLPAKCKQIVIASAATSVSLPELKKADYIYARAATSVSLPKPMAYKISRA